METDKMSISIEMAIPLNFEIDVKINGNRSRQTSIVARRSTWKSTWRPFARAASANDLYWIIDFSFSSPRDDSPLLVPLVIDPTMYNGSFSLPTCISLPTATLAVKIDLSPSSLFVFVFLFYCCIIFVLFLLWKYRLCSAKKEKK